MQPIVQVADLSKHYPGAARPAVTGLTFSIARGEIFGLLGPNGAGKTTTVSMLSCLLQPSGGTAKVAGFDVVDHPDEVKKRIGLVPQDVALYPALSARDNLRFFGRIYGVGGAALRRRVDDLLELAGLTARADDEIRTFSGGMKRRVNIAAGLMHQPDVLFLDEPAVGVDPQSREFIFEGFEALKASGLAVLLTTHYMEEAERLCDRVAIIDHGRVVALDAPASLTGTVGNGLIALGIPHDLGGSVLDAIRTLGDVEGVDRVDGQVRVAARSPQRVLPGILRVLNDADVSLTSLEILRPNLETVFLQLTGKRLRD
jgi:ABC-2 type transport system ATP-binding protein